MIRMIEIGKKRLQKIRVMSKTPEGKRVFTPKLGPDGQVETKLVANEPVRITKGCLDGCFCRDSGKRLVVTLKDGDVLHLRPQGTRQVASATLASVYGWMLRSAADSARMAKLREKKAAKAIKRAERSLRKPLR